MGVRRTTIELDETLVAQAVTATGATLRSTVEQGLRLLVNQNRDLDDERRRALAAHLATTGERVDFEVASTEEAWR